MRAEPPQLSLIAYRTRPTDMRIEVAAAERKWMNDTELSFANRCLPLRIANQGGWFVLNGQKLEAIWNGGNDISDLTIRYFTDSSVETGPSMDSVASHFGHGLLTWRIPYLFRTHPHYNLYVRGPANGCKDGASPLDAIVETDWAVSTFTMNWKITRAGVPISFEKGEPICMIFPQLRGNLERFCPEIKDISSDPELESKFKEWACSRYRFNEELKAARVKRTWQKHYYGGKCPSGEFFPDHQLRLLVRDFKDVRGTTVRPPPSFD